MVAFGDFQIELYLAGLGGQAPPWPVSFPGWEAAAGAALTPEAHGYVAGSAGLERTAKANTDAFSRWHLVPRHMRAVHSRDLSTTVLGTTMPAPVLLAPVGVLGIVHPDAELAVARAATALGVPMVLSTVSSTSMEDVAATLDTGDSAGWYQLYWPRSRPVAASFVKRAEAAGYRAVVVTLDTWALAWRPRDLDRAYLPFLTGEGMGTYFTDPAFRAGLERTPEEDLAAAVLSWSSMFGDPSLTWEDLAWLREQTSLPIVVKGICHPDDARAALDAGVEGMIVSNHGGRQVDGARPALDCLPEVVTAVGGDVPVLFDSGVRSGSDIAKALALGAAAVLVGRPYVYGLAMGGEAGVRHVLRCLLADLDLTMALSGHRSPTTLGPDDLVPADR